MTKKQIKEIIDLLEKSMKDHKKKDEAYEKYAKLEFEDQYTPWLSNNITFYMLKIIGIIDELFYNDLEYLIYELDNDWPDDKVVVTQLDGTEITKGEYRGWLIEEYGE